MGKEAQELLEQMSFEKYQNFSSFETPEEEKERLKNLIRDSVSEAIILEVEENVLNEEEKKKLPIEIQRFKNYTEGKGITYYILKTNDSIAKIFVGVSGWTSGRENSSYMQEILQDPKLQNKIRTIKTSYSELLTS